MKRFLTGFFAAVAIVGLVICGAEAGTMTAQYAVCFGGLSMFAAGSYGLIQVNRE